MARAEIERSFERIAAEHAEFRKINEGLRGFLDRPRPEIGHEGYHRWAAGLARHLVDLHDKLVIHFRHEEQDGFFEAIVDQAPSFAKRVDALSGEHGTILDGVRDLMNATLRYSEGKEPVDPHLRTRITTVLDQLGEHEFAETELMQRVEYRDIGVGD